jgi:hypothetical protein
MLGLDISDRHGEHLQLHQNFVKLLAEWANRQSMYGLYGGLKPDIQTHLEDGMQMAGSHRLMPKVGERVATFEELATLAIQHEARSRNRTKDTARLLHQLGFPVNKIPKTKAIAKQTAGNQLSDSDEESQHSSDEDDTGTAENGANTGWYEEGTAENGADTGWYAASLGGSGSSSFRRLCCFPWRQWLFILSSALLLPLEAVALHPFIGSAASLGGSGSSSFHRLCCFPWMQWPYFLSSHVMALVPKHFDIFFISVIIGICWCRGTLIAAGSASLRTLLVDLRHLSTPPALEPAAVNSATVSRSALRLKGAVPLRLVLPLALGLWLGSSSAVPSSYQPVSAPFSAVPSSDPTKG